MKDKLKYYLFEDSKQMGHYNQQSLFLCNSVNPLIFEKDISKTGYIFLEFISGQNLNDWFIKDEYTTLEYAKKQIDSFKIVNVVENIEFFMQDINKWFIENYSISLQYNPLIKIKQSKNLYLGNEYSTGDLLSMLTEDDKINILLNNKIDYDIYNYIKQRISKI